MALVRPTSNTLPLRAPIANVTNRLHPWDQVPLTSSQAPKSWLDLNAQKPLTRTGAESPSQPAQQEDVRTYEIRKIEEDSQDLVPEKDEPEPSLPAIEGTREILAYSREPRAKPFPQSSLTLYSSKTASELDAGPAITPETHAKASPQSRSANLPRLAPKPNRASSSRIVPESDRILRSQSKAEFSFKTRATRQQSSKDRIGNTPGC